MAPLVDYAGTDHQRSRREALLVSKAIAILVFESFINFVVIVWRTAPAPFMLILSKRGNFNMYEQKGLSMIMACAKAGSTSLLTRLIVEGADISQGVKMVSKFACKTADPVRSVMRYRPLMRTSTARRQ